MNDKHPPQAIGLETRHIFFDTQVYRGYGHDLSVKSLEVLAGYIAEDILILHTTDITLREVSAQLDAMQLELVTKANRSARLLDRWNRKLRDKRNWFTVPEKLDPPASPTNAYRDFERTLLYRWNVKCHKAADLSMGAVLDQYFLREAPFDKDGSKEFPDAMALLALEAWCQQAREKCYVVSKDQAVQRAADKSEHLIPIDSLEKLLSVLTSAQDHDIADKVGYALRNAPLSDKLEEILSTNMIHFGGLYDGDRMDGEVGNIEFAALNEISSVTVLRVDKDKVACLLGIKMDVTAEISFSDETYASWDNESGRFFGLETEYDDVDDTVPVRIFIELTRDDGEFLLDDFQFITSDLTISDYNSDGYPYK
ncbi:hypothetical protein GCM10007094_13080 [Pseudovibrio japonicus]|uniref:DUF4935 domain-containing protein n=2 Tax=Pseudovibrio japonicus TaxID=366534 RepID=A0ABQ3E4V1_9HYPH|nr:hypothetical protein GCM10007094_13080 [Pseudovibrio japonicus]